MREYKGFKYALSRCGNEYHYWTEKTLRMGKKQIKLATKTIPAAEKEVQEIINNILKPKQ